MSVQSLIDSLPDLVLLIRRDGTIIAHAGGRGVPDLKPAACDSVQRCERLWPENIAVTVLQLVRKAVAGRATAEVEFTDRGQRFQARCSAQGPDSAVCVVRLLSTGDGGTTLDTTGVQAQPHLDRRGFLRRFRKSMSTAALSEKPTAVAAIQVDGVSDIAQLIDTRVSEQLINTAIMRLPRAATHAGSEHPWWYLGQLSDSVLIVVLETADRDAIETCVSQISASLREPILFGDTAFHLTPYAGVAILGQDAVSAELLLDHARAAANEARRAGLTCACFFTDTLNLQTLVQLDIAHELRTAITKREICLRYVGRHDLATGRRLCQLGYLDASTARPGTAGRVSAHRGEYRARRDAVARAAERLAAGLRGNGEAGR